MHNLRNIINFWAHLIQRVMLGTVMTWCPLSSHVTCLTYCSVKSLGQLEPILVMHIYWILLYNFYVVFFLFFSLILISVIFCRFLNRIPCITFIKQTWPRSYGDLDRKNQLEPKETKTWNDNWFSFSLLFWNFLPLISLEKFLSKVVQQVCCSILLSSDILVKTKTQNL